MEVSGRIGGLGLELLNQSNYKVWRTCMELYLVGEDLWDVVNGNNTNAPANTPDDADAMRKWRQVNAKAEFVLKRSISSTLFDHIIGCKSATEIWETLDRLSNKKDEARLQIMENEFANTTQGNLSISEYFLKVKKLGSEISLLNPEEAISEARQRHCIIRGLRPEYTHILHQYKDGINSHLWRNSKISCPRRRCSQSKWLASPSKKEKEQPYSPITRRTSQQKRRETSTLKAKKEHLLEVAEISNAIDAANWGTPRNSVAPS